MKQNVFSVDHENDRTGRFQVSIALLCLAVLVMSMFIIFYMLMIGVESDPENDQIPGMSTFAVIAAGAAVMFSGFIASCIASVCTLIGFCLGFSSIKYLPTKGMAFWAKAVSAVNLVLFITSFVGLIYFAKLFV